MIRHYELEQNTEEWLKARLGKVTASVAKQLLTGTFKISKDKKLKVLAYQIASERILERIGDNYQSWDMQRGHIEEPMARELYEQHTGKPVDQCGFITNDQLGFELGFSPDGLVGDDGIIEIKCKKEKFQVQTFHLNEVPSEYMAQIQLGLYVSGRKWCDFVQYSNGMPLFVKRVTVQEEIIMPLLKAIEDFELEVIKIVSDYYDKIKGMPVADYIEYATEEDLEGTDD